MTGWIRPSWTARRTAPGAPRGVIKPDTHTLVSTMARSSLLPDLSHSVGYMTLDLVEITVSRTRDVLAPVEQLNQSQAPNIIVDPLEALPPETIVNRLAHEFCHRPSLKTADGSQRYI